VYEDITFIIAILDHQICGIRVECDITPISGNRRAVAISIPLCTVCGNTYTGGGTSLGIMYEDIPMTIIVPYDQIGGKRAECDITPISGNRRAVATRRISLCTVCCDTDTGGSIGLTRLVEEERNAT